MSSSAPTEDWALCRVMRFVREGKSATKLCHLRFRQKGDMALDLQVKACTGFMMVCDEQPGTNF